MLIFSLHFREVLLENASGSYKLGNEYVIYWIVQLLPFTSSM
ncbi:hypothetical protein Anacy_5165 [Anabaena cylindrica PCC 7122]|uniref:Uncharacterized protein n=1 Tax=Anabaena cylindrica (strain ATCC 27899 / PCC 7122) TaxID=272123 RepID=K9ZMR7_ANACC|nr:hypothetical protein Anacy_5165 [Anabaena cylindrica PCC 7122]BAY02424.1 hypothetical protein NIES19_16670 [Anabaena cylindrica PCC 7122]